MFGPLCTNIEYGGEGGDLVVCVEDEFEKLFDGTTAKCCLIMSVNRNPSGV